MKSLFIHYSCLVNCGGAWSAGLHMHADSSILFQGNDEIVLLKKCTIAKRCPMSMSRINIVTVGLWKPKYYPSTLKLNGFL